MDNEKIAHIKEWLGSGSINIFGLPMRGKDTVGKRLAEALDARFLSSGAILRERAAKEVASGMLVETELFRSLVLPYFSGSEFYGRPLILSSIGRWSGEEKMVMDALERSGHPLKAVLLLDVSEVDVRNRWETARVLGERGKREDDSSKEIFETRLREFDEKTVPVIQRYLRMGLLVHAWADGSRDAVFTEVIENLWKKSIDKA